MAKGNWLAHTRLTAAATRGVLSWVSTEKPLVAFVALLTAAVAPVTTLISSHATLAVEREKSASALLLERQKQRHAIRLSYLDKLTALPPGSSPRGELLRFLAANDEDPDLSGWARETLSREPVTDTTPCGEELGRCVGSCYRASEERTSANPSGNTNPNSAVDCADACAEFSVVCENSKANAAKSAPRLATSRMEGWRCIDSCLRSDAERYTKPVTDSDDDWYRRHEMDNCARDCLGLRDTGAKEHGKHSAPAAPADSSKSN